MKAKFLTAFLISGILFVSANKSYAHNQPPHADLEAVPVCVLIGDSVTLDGCSSYDSDGYITQWWFSWDWDTDPTWNYCSTTYCETTHVYPGLGEYHAKLRVKDNGGAKDTDTCTVYVVRVKNITQGTGYSTIQAAINDANNDTIVVSQGTYYEALDFIGKAITVRSTDPNDWTVIANTIVDVNDPNASVVTFKTSEDPNSVLRGFTITGGYRGIYCCGDASPTIGNCMIKGNANQ